jgi:predicted AAA+ superfamily ATPase
MNLSKTVGIDKETVVSYIDLLEKSFVVYRLNPLIAQCAERRSPPREKYTFMTMVSAMPSSTILSQSGQRNDVGALWENYFITERTQA